MSGSEQTDIQKFKRNVEKELKDNILGYWAKYTVDHENGGFYGQISDDLQVAKDASKSLVLNTRLLWTFSKAYRSYGDQQYLELAQCAYDYLLANFRDKEYGGYYWMVDYQGNPVDVKKQTYGQAFAIYALSEYHLATGNEESLKHAVDLFKLLQCHVHDTRYHGYIEACTREWGWTDDFRLSQGALNARKSMNTSLHVLEAFTNLYRVWKTEEMRMALKEMIEVMIDHVIDPVTFHYKLFFDEAWNSKQDVVSYGHDIEGSWLIYEAAHVLEDRQLIDKVKGISISMAQAIYEEGMAPDGGILEEADENGLVTTDKTWWPQAEGVVGFINAYHLTLEQRFLDAAIQCWDYIENTFVDKTYGEWFSRVSDDRLPYRNMAKVSAWKCPYHNARACFEILERV